MRIILMRHGKPAMPPSGIITANQFRFWVESYNNASLCEHSSPSEQIKILASTCNAVMCSNLKRSIESANQLGVTKPYKIEHNLREMEMPSAAMGLIKLSPSLWSVIFRALWVCGFSSNSESFSQAKIRANSAAEFIINIAKEKQSVLFLGHGLLNHYIAKHLLSNGWKCLQKPGSYYWSYGVFELSNI